MTTTNPTLSMIPGTNGMSYHGLTPDGYKVYIGPCEGNKQFVIDIEHNGSNIYHGNIRYVNNLESLWNSCNDTIERDRKKATGHKPTLEEAKEIAVDAAKRVR
jgi:hypothetical protein